MKGNIQEIAARFGIKPEDIQVIGCVPAQAKRESVRNTEMYGIMADDGEGVYVDLNIAFANANEAIEYAKLNVGTNCRVYKMVAYVKRSVEIETFN